MQVLESVDKPKSPKDHAATSPPTGQTEALPRRFERFTLLSRVARGGMGEVYLATAAGIEGAERPLIVKIIRPDHAEDRSFKARFLDEARIQAQLQHPGVAQILEATTDAAGAPYVVVEHIEGRNLSEVRGRAAQLGLRIGWPEAMAIAVCLGEALMHVHERTCPDGRPLEIVHRDLSPQNVMIGYGGEVKLIDFGTARGQNRRCQTISGIVFAKPGYVAPEVANNTPGGVPADLYAFGVVLWELIAGRRFLTGEATEHMAAVGAGKRTLPPLAQLIGCPPEVDQLVMRLTATRIEDRYPSARAATQDIVRILQRAPSLADGDRSVRGRISDLLRRLYPAEPARSRADFARRVTDARSVGARPAPLPVASPEPPEASDPLVLAGTRYRLGRPIGRGAMGVVYEAEHLDLGRPVALKLLDADSLSEKARSRFRFEARAIAQVEHENLVAIYDYGVCQDGRPFYAMERLHGESLDLRFAREGKLGLDAVLGFAISACGALEAAHRVGVVHRDVKPANLFITESGVLKVLDFGVAKTGSSPSAEAPEEGVELVGTPEYMAPEQARGESDPRSDVYALASVIYELVTGSLPFPAESVVAMLAEKAAERPQRPSARAPAAAIPAALDRVLLSALDPEPARRPATIRGFCEELERVRARALTSAGRRRRYGRATLSVFVAASIAVLSLAGARRVELFQVPLSSLSSLETSTQSLRGVTGAAASRIERAIAELTSRSEPPGKTSDSVARGFVPALEHAAQADAAPPPEHVRPDAKAPTAVLAEQAPRPSGAGAAFGEDAEAEAQKSATQPTAPAPAAALVTARDPALARAEAFEREGRDLRALEVLRAAATAESASSELLSRLTRALMKTGAWGEAQRSARRRAALDPSVDARLELARVERAMGNRDRAIELVKEVLKDPAAPAEAKNLLSSLAPVARVALRD
jgi:serine/threonine-protein kinase